ncbi:MAG: hypothetical protein V1822_03800 [Candidatus Micrarchaeota archaeon]
MRKFLCLVLLCAIILSSFADSISIISPQDGYQTYSKQISAQAYYNSSGTDYDLAICQFNVDGTAQASASIPAQQQHTFAASQPLPAGTHTFEILCGQKNSTTNETISQSLSDSISIVILPTQATLQILSPQTGSVSSSRANTFSFKYSPQDTGPSSPICYFEAGVSRLAQASAVDDETTQISATLPYGTSVWRIHCTDNLGFEIYSPAYSIEISPPPTFATGGGEVGTPYKREIQEPKPVSGPLEGPITGSLIDSGNSAQDPANSAKENASPPAQAQLERAVLAATQSAVVGDSIILRALSASGQPLVGAQVHIVDPQNNLLYATTDSQGMAQFSANAQGLYLYKMPDYELEFLPTTQVSGKKQPQIQTADAIEAQLPKQPASADYDLSPRGAEGNPWLLWGGASLLFIIASFLVLMRFSSG